MTTQSTEALTEKKRFSVRLSVGLGHSVQKKELIELPHQQIALRVEVSSFDTVLDALVDEERISIDVNISKLIQFLGGELPPEVQPAFIDQCAAFLEHICEAGSEADLIREYLGDLVTKPSRSAKLFIALRSLTHKDLLAKESLENVGDRISAVVSALNEPYITKLVVASLLNGKDLPADKGDLRALFLSLL